MKAVILGAASGILVMGSENGLSAGASGSVLVEVVPSLVLLEAAPFQVVNDSEEAVPAFFPDTVCNLRGEYSVMASPQGDFAFEFEGAPRLDGHSGSVLLVCGRRTIRMDARIAWEPFALEGANGRKLCLGGTVELPLDGLTGQYSGACRMRVVYR